MKRAIFCAFICAVAGFAIAAYVGTVNPATAASWMSTTVAYILFPPAILARLSMTDPDPEKHLATFWPSQRYGCVGFILWRKSHRVDND